ADPDNSGYAFGEFAELKRRYSVAFNGKVLHELYFENMGHSDSEPSRNMLNLLDEVYGSRTDWEKDFTSTGSAGPGWVILAYNASFQTLENLLITEHHIGWP